MDEEILVFLLVATGACVGLALPIVLLIWLIVLSKRVSSLKAEVISLKRRLAQGAPALPVIAPVSPNRAMALADAAPELPAAAALTASVAGNAPFQTAENIAAAVSVFKTQDLLSIGTEAPAVNNAETPAESKPAGRLSDDKLYNQPLQSQAIIQATDGASKSKPDRPEPVLPDEGEQAQVSPSPAAASSENDGGVAGFMLGNIFNKLGALVVIIAAGIFVKLIAPYVFFNPWVKLISGYLAGSAVLGAGLLMHSKGKYRNYAEVLIGLGLAIDFVMTYASCTVIEVLSSQTALVIACVLLVLVYGLAAYMKRPSMLVIGLVAGYANLFIGSKIGPVFVSVYMLLLNVMTLTSIYRARMWLLVGNINLALSLIVLLDFLCSYFNGSSEQLAVFTCLSFWLLYVVFDVLRYRHGICARFANFSSYLNFTCLSLFTGIILYAWEHSAFQIGLAMLVISAGYAALSAYYKAIDEKIGHAHLNMCLLALLVGVEALDQGVITAAVLVGIALGLALWATINKRKALLNWVLVYLSSSLWPLLFGPSGIALLELSTADNILQALMRLYLLELGLPAAGFMLAAYLLQVRGHDEGLSSYCLTFKLLGWTLLYILLSVEINPLFGQVVGGWFRRLVNQGSIYCVIAFVYSLQWYNIGKFQNKPLVRGLAYFVYAWTVCCLGALLLMCAVDGGSTSFVPFFGLRFCAVVVGLVTTFVLYRGTQLRLLAYVALALGFGGLHVEACSLAEHTVSYVITACWLAYAALTVLVGIYKPNKDCTYGGIFLVLLTVGRLFVVDTSDLDEVFKLLLFVAVGGALLALSFLYTKWYKADKHNAALQPQAEETNSAENALL
ncbi:MAG: DUF2339 domain-containing protein [bacterium]|nr:DUF2339 domain-containing protein [bacterium]